MRLGAGEDARAPKGIVMLSNNHPLEYLDDYLHGALSDAAASSIERHCQDCPICTVALDEARKRQAAMRTLPPREASDRLIDQTLGRVERYERTSGRARRYFFRGALSLAAASIAIVGTLHLYYVNLKPSPLDLQVLGQSEWLADTAASLRVRLVDRSDSRALTGVPVRIELVGRDRPPFRLASFTTDALGSGQPRFHVPDWSDGDYELRVTADVPREPESIARTVKLKRSWKLMLTTDKPVYQPGQMIRMRSLALRRPDCRPVAGSDVTFAINDPKGNVIFKHRDVTSRFGISSADCPLADEIIEGPYTIECTVGDVSSTSTVDVRHYVLPKFKVDVTLDRTFYQPGQTVRGTVQADYFFGQPVAGGTARVEVRAMDVQPTTLRTLDVPIDADGRGEFTFAIPEKLIGREPDAGDARLSINLSVTDTAGQQHSREIDCVVTSQPLRIEVIPESGTLVRGLPNTIYLFVIYAHGRPAPRVRLAISQVDREVVTSDLGVASFELTPSADEIPLTIRATDADGLLGRRQMTLRCGRTSGDFLIRTDRAVYDGGQTMQLMALGGGIEPVFVDFIKDGQTLATHSIEVSAGRGELAFDLPPELFGTIELCAYRFGAAGLAVRKTRVIYVRQAGELRVDAKLDLTEYRPGEKAKLTLSLRDERGKAAPGAISLAAVDEAVFSVLSQAPGMERAFFNLEQDLLKPVYAIYPWSPDLNRNDTDGDGRELATVLFARAGRASQRDAVLERLVRNGDITPKQLEVLDVPDLDEIFERTYMPDHIAALLRESSMHSLSATSWPSKRMDVARTKTVRIEALMVAWAAIGIGIAATVLIWLFLVVRRSVIIAVCCVLALPILYALMPSLSRARELSKRLVAAADLSGIAKSLQILENDERSLDAPNAADGGQHVTGVRVREWFPETLLWRPELITDDDGRASLEIDLADSITTWRLTASAVSADGKLGGGQSSIRVFQPFFVDFNLPVSLTRGDQAAVPVVVYNYLDQPQSVELTLDQADGFERLDGDQRRVELAAGEVRSTSFRLRADRVGSYTLQVTARGAGVADAVKRTIEVVPNGERVEQLVSGTLDESADVRLTVPAEAIDGSVSAVVKLYPSNFSQLVEGLESIFRQPYGCFEQTSSTTYPNVLALDYLRRNKLSVPEVEAKARQYIHLGYQRLLGFEVDGGGFDWFGRPPANRTLTAYGLMEFVDMARVHDVDPKLIERTRAWLLAQRRADGSWAPESHGMHVDPTRRGQADEAALSTTAYIAWAVFGNAEPPPVGARASSPANVGERDGHRPTLNWLLAHEPESIGDPYVLGLVCNALLAIDATQAGPYLDRLLDLRRSDAKLTWWEQSANSRTTFYGAGRSGSIETTALAALALIESHKYPAAARGALSWLVQQKDSLGTFHSTQATVLALKALLAGSGAQLGEPRERRVDIAVEGKTVRQVTIAADQGDVVRDIDVSDLVGPGDTHLQLSEPSASGLGYQVVLAYYVPAGRQGQPREPLSITVAYDRTNLYVGDTVTATATVSNNLATSAPMVILDLPIPAGFAIEPADLAKLRDAGQIAKYQINARSAVVYLRAMDPGKPLTLRYRLRATMPVQLTVPGGRAYEYYDRDREAIGQPASLTVRERA